MADTEYIISLEEQNIIKDYVKDCYSKNLLKNNGYNKWRGLLYKLTDIPKCLYEIKNKIIELENLHDYLIKPDLNDYIDYMIEGAYVNNNTTNNSNGLVHVRYNVFIQLPDEGGHHIYARQKIFLEERMYVACKSGLDNHNMTTINGDKESIILSFGFLIPYEKAINIKYKITGIVEHFNNNNIPLTFFGHSLCYK